MLFHLAPLVVSGRTKTDLLRDVLVREGLFIAVMFVTATLIYWVVRLPRSRAPERSFFNVLAGASALVAVPFCWLYIVHATWLNYEPRNFWDACGIRSALELSAAVALLYVVRNRSIWYGVVLVALHFVWWVFAVCQLDDGAFVAGVNLSLPLSLVFPIAGLVWLRSVHGVALEKRH